MPVLERFVPLPSRGRRSGRQHEDLCCFNGHLRAERNRTSQELLARILAGECQERRLQYLNLSPQRLTISRRCSANYSIMAVSIFNQVSRPDPKIEKPAKFMWLEFEGRKTDFLKNTPKFIMGMR